LSSKLSTAKAEAATLQDQVVSLGVKEAELSSKLRSSQAKITWLQAKLVVLRMESSQRVKGDAGGQVLRPTSSEHRALII
ncbi:hypothetical protein ACLOJK_006471, partial [Asimina triloba]